MRMSPPPEGEETVGGGWAEFVRETSPQFRRPTIEQLETVTAPIWAEFVDGAEYSHDRLTEIWAELRPDAIVHDCVASFPSVSLAGCPWIRVVSANPLRSPTPTSRRCSPATRHATAAAGTNSRWSIAG